MKSYSLNRTKERSKRINNKIQKKYSKLEEIEKKNTNKSHTFNTSNTKTYKNTHKTKTHIQILENVYLILINVKKNYIEQEKINKKCK